MTARSIVELLNVFGYVLSGEHTVFIDSLFDTLLLQAREERLGHSVVPAVASAAHTGLEAVGSAESLPVIAAILGPLIGMNHGVSRATAPYRHQHGIENQLPMQGGSSGPPDDYSREKIHHDRKIKPAPPKCEHT